MLKLSWFILIILSSVYCYDSEKSAKSNNERGEVGTYKNKFIWKGNDHAFVPNYIMLDVLINNINKYGQGNYKEEMGFNFRTGNYPGLGLVNEKNLDEFIEEF